MMSRTKEQLSNNQRLKVEPIRLLTPHPQHIEDTRSRIHNPKDKIPFILPLSAAPSRVWCGTFYRFWDLFFGIPAPAVHGKSSSSLWVEAKPSEIDSYIEMAQMVVNITNYVSPPLIRLQDAASRAAKLRDQRMRDLAQQHSQPVSVPADRRYFKALGDIRNRQAEDRNEAEAEAGRRDFDDSMTRLMDLLIDDAVASVITLTRSINPVTK